ncbi:MAG: hypothetical protein NTY38_25435, partial [Acidobacteria bacterium]|nr:hypothetical protein [Acidobacteriota bacterium]
MRRLLIAVILLAANGLAADSIRLGSRKELFLDDYLVASASNLRRVIHPARKSEANPVLWDAVLY